jgi:hypothetical protein
MSLPITFENIVTGQSVKLSRRPQVEAYIKSGDVHKNAHVYDLGWRVDPEVRALWEARYADKNFIRTFAKERKMNPVDVNIYHIIDAWLDEIFQVDELENRASRENNGDAQKDYLKRVADASKPKPATKQTAK